MTSWQILSSPNLKVTVLSICNRLKTVTDICYSYILELFFIAQCCILKQRFAEEDDTHFIVGVHDSWIKQLLLAQLCQNLKGSLNVDWRASNTLSLCVNHLNCVLSEHPGITLKPWDYFSVHSPFVPTVFSLVWLCWFLLAIDVLIACHRLSFAQVHTPWSWRASSFCSYWRGTFTAAKTRRIDGEKFLFRIWTVISSYINVHIVYYTVLIIV